MEIQIIADSCCDLTPTLRRVLRVRTASLTIRVDDGEFIDDENLDIPALMAAMKQSPHHGLPRAGGLCRHDDAGAHDIRCDAFLAPFRQL